MACNVCHLNDFPSTTSAFYSRQSTSQTGHHVAIHDVGECHLVYRRRYLYQPDQNHLNKGHSCCVLWLKNGSQQQAYWGLLQDCNLVLYNGNYLTQAPSYQNAVYATNTYSGYTGFCTGVVSSANGGSLKVSSAPFHPAQPDFADDNLGIWQTLP